MYSKSKTTNRETELYTKLYTDKLYLTKDFV